MEVTLEQPVAAQWCQMIDHPSVVGECRREAVRLAQQYGLGEEVSGRAAIVATELTNNLLQHGGGGELLVQAVAANSSRHLIEILAIDRGPGMESTERCLRDGYSTAGTMGTGLGAVRRLASEFDLYSSSGAGTVVMARVGAGTAPHVGAVNRALTGELECGDSWRLACTESVTALLVVDGLGHGTFAAQAAQIAVSAFDQGPHDPPQQLIERLHRVLSGTRGAAAACARIERDGRVSYAGVGNIHAALVSGDSARSLVSHNGILGLRVSRLRQFEYQRSPGALLVMHSDGLSARWNLSSKPGLLQRHPGVIAAVLYRDHARSHDDATVVVLR
jgi:anti-sigma regulatory factor (Ser/Thr protein kinase)